MRKQLFKTAVATATALSIAVMPALTVCAEDVTEPVYVDGESITIDGDLDVTLEDQDRHVFAISAENGGEVVVNGDVTVTDKQYYVSESIKAQHDSSIWIKGDCNVDSVREPFPLFPSYGGMIIVDGNVNSNMGGVNLFNGSVYVGGDISTEDESLNLYCWDNSDKYAVVEGTVHSENGAAILIDSYMYSYQTVQEIVNQLPDIAVFALDAKDDEHLISGAGLTIEDEYSLPEEEVQAKRQEAAELFSAAINYIIHTEGGEISFSGDDLLTAADFGIDDPDKNFTTTKFGKTFTATVGSNYALEGNESVEVTKISDGVYSVKLIDRKGGILLAATALSPDPGPGQDDPVVIIIPNATPSSSSESQSSSSDTASYSDMPAGAVTVSLARSSAPTAAAGAGPAVLGATREPSRSVAIRVGQLTGAQFKQTIINNINATPAGGMLRIETDKIACFDKAMLEAFAKKGNIDMEVVFPIGSKKMNVTIPAGHDVSKLLDKKGYCGFLNLLAVFGTETEE